METTQLLELEDSAVYEVEDDEVDLGERAARAPLPGRGARR